MYVIFFIFVYDGGVGNVGIIFRLYDGLFLVLFMVILC